MPTAFAGGEQLERDALLSAPLRWPRPSALEHEPAYWWLVVAE